MRTRVVLFVVGLSATGGGDSATATLDAVPLLAPIVSQGVRGIGAFGLERATFATAARGTLDARVDWGSPENDVDVYLVAGDCPEARLSAGECPMLVFSESMSAKPERLIVRLPRGVYTLGVLSQSPRAEELRWRVALR